MFSKEVYVNRRNQLKKSFSSGILFFPGNNEMPCNYSANTYPFRQDSNFLYYFGVDTPGLAAVIDIDENKEIIFGDELTVDDIVWMGQLTTVKENASSAGIENVFPFSELSNFIEGIIKQERKIHFVRQYRSDLKNLLSSLLGISYGKVNDYASSQLHKAIVMQRSVKEDIELAEIDYAVDTAYLFHTEAMRKTKPGKYEREISGLIEGIAKQRGFGLSFQPIFSIRGETLHNNFYGNVMKEGDLVVADCGAENSSHYASDITRSYPVSGKFSQKQKEIYEIVLEAQKSSIDAIKPGVKYKEIHLLAAKIIASGLKNLGLMKNDVDAAVANGAHALFFPHGLGHMMGLDVHDMENLGEEFVGYDKNTQRSEQFGLGYLRLAKELLPGYVLTVEPGIYFIEPLIDKWIAEKKYEEFINYEKVKSYIGFGGIRIEDNVVVTNEGKRILGTKLIPKETFEIENIIGKDQK